MKLNKKEIAFIYNSNKIEQIMYPLKEYSKDPDKSDPHVGGHIKAFLYMKENCKKDLTEKDILIMHRLLTKDILRPKDSGAYRTCAVYISGRQAPMYYSVKPMMETLIEFAKRVGYENDIWNVHHEFEIIHPFVDGNGRTGRLILNWLRFKNDLPLEIVLYKDRMEYYTSIEKYRIGKIVSKKLGELNGDKALY